MLKSSHQCVRLFACVASAVFIVGPSLLWAQDSSEQATESSISIDELESQAVIISQQSDPSSAEQVLGEDELTEVANQARDWVNESEASDESRLRAAQVEMIARQALVEQAAQEHDSIHTGLRAAQLRASASSLEQQPITHAQEVADYFGLVVRLGEIQRDPASLSERQAQAMDKLNAFISDHHRPDSPLVDAARLSLAVLRGQSGQSLADSELIRAAADVVVEQDPAFDALQRYAHRSYQIERSLRLDQVMGEQEDISRIETDEKFVVLHYIQTSAPESMELMFDLRRLLDQLGEDRLKVISIGLGPITPDSHQAGWIVLSSDGQTYGAEHLQVEVVPTLAIFNDDGILIAVGESRSVLSRLKTLAAELPEAKVESETEAKVESDADESEAETTTEKEPLSDAESETQTTPESVEALEDVSEQDENDSP